MNSVDKNQVKEILKKAQNILIAPSTPVDGDSIGSALALMHILTKMGKMVTVASTTDIPTYLKFLPFTKIVKSELGTTGKDFVISLNTEGAEVDHLKYEVEQGKINIIVTPKNGSFNGHDLSFTRSNTNFDLIITVDTGDLVQLGSLIQTYKDIFANTPLLNIDHHASNSKFGTYNFLDYNVAATTEMLTPVIFELEKEFGEEFVDEDVATLLLVGIITDTGSFQHSNTSPEAFEVAADLLERGARQQEIIKHIFKTKSLNTLKLWGRVLSKIKYDPNSRLVYSTISQQDLAETGASSDDTGGIIDELMSNAPDAEVVLLLKEKEPGFISGSLRAPGKLADVSEIAGQIGGGGHKKAAGFRIRDKSMEEAMQIAQNTVAKYMNIKLNTPVENNSHQNQFSGKMFPGLVTKPQTSVPKPSPGGEDMLLEDFKKRQNSEEEKLKENTTKFFQDKDGQETVGDVLSQMDQDGIV